MRNFLATASLFLAICFFALAAHAQSPIFLRPLTTAAAAPVDTVKTLPVVPDNYVWPDLENLSKLYWMLGKFDPNDTQAIDGFLYINDCGIYKNYYSNDLEWVKIRAAAAKDIANQVRTYPTNFEVMIPITLGRYNDALSYFEISEDSALDKRRRFEVFANQNEDVCGSEADVPGYPRGLILNLDRQITVGIIPMDPRAAQIYMHTGVANLRRERVAYLRLKVHITQYISTERARNMQLAATVFGHLDGLEVYADTAKTELLYKIDSSELKDRGTLVMTPTSPDPRVSQDPPPVQDIAPSPGAAPALMPLH